MEKCNVEELAISTVWTLYHSHRWAVPALLSLRPQDPSIQHSAAPFHYYTTSIFQYYMGDSTLSLLDSKHHTMNATTAIST